MGESCVFAQARQQKTIRVLDLASNGTARNGYGFFLRPRGTPVRIKAYAKFGENKDSRTENIRLKQRNGFLPDCLISEPSDAYDHVHFHMADGKTFLEEDVVEVFSEIRRVLHCGGFLLFSADVSFFSSGFTKSLDMTAFEFTDLALCSEFKIAFRFSTNDAISPVMKQPAIELAKSFCITDLSCDNAHAGQLFSLFSRWTHLGEYFAIAVKE